MRISWWQIYSLNSAEKPKNQTPKSSVNVVIKLLQKWPLPCVVSRIFLLTIVLQVEWGWVCIGCRSVVIRVCTKTNKNRKKSLNGHCISAACTTVPRLSLSLSLMLQVANSNCTFVALQSFLTLIYANNCCCYLLSVSLWLEKSCNACAAACCCSCCTDCKTFILCSFSVSWCCG